MGRKDHNSSILVPAWVPPTLFQLPQLHPHLCSKPTYYDSAHLSWCSLVTRISFRTYLVPKSVLRCWLTLLPSCVDFISGTCLLSYHELFSTVGSHRSPWAGHPSILMASLSRSASALGMALHLYSLVPAPGSVGEGPLLVLVFPKLDAICHPGPVTLAGSLNTLS